MVLPIIGRKKQVEAERKNPILNPQVSITNISKDITKDASDSLGHYIVELPPKKFFKVREIEYTILKLLDGRHSAESIQQEVLKTSDIEMPIHTIEEFIDEVIALGIVSPRPMGTVRKRFNFMAPAVVYTCLSVIFNPSILAFLMINGLAGFLLFLFNIREIFHVITLRSSFYFPVIFITVYLLTSVFHELGHGAALRYFNYKPGPIQVKLGNGVFLLHFSTPFLIHSPNQPMSRKIKLTIISGGMIVDAILLAMGVYMFRFVLHSWHLIKVFGILLSLTALCRILLSLNFFNENSDMAKILEHYFEPEATDFKKHIMYKFVGTVFWILQYSVFFFLIYLFLYLVHSMIMRP